MNIERFPVGQIPVIPGVVIRSRPVGVPPMEDERGLYEKILCVPIDEPHPIYRNIGSYRDLRPILIDQIAHFFEHYKDLDPGKWVKGMRGAKAKRRWTSSNPRCSAPNNRPGEAPGRKEPNLR